MSTFASFLPRRRKNAKKRRAKIEVANTCDAVPCHKILQDESKMFQVVVYGCGASFGSTQTMSGDLRYRGQTGLKLGIL